MLKMTDWTYEQIKSIYKCERLPFNMNRDLI